MGVEESLVLSIVIVILVIFIIFIVFWIIVLKKEIPEPPPVAITKSNFGMRCVTDEKYIIDSNTPLTCIDNLVCESQNGVTGFCKVPIGGPCGSLSECTNNAKVCTNVCAIDFSGGLNQESKNGVCDEGLTLNSDNICKLNVNEINCITNSDCIQGICQNINGRNTCIMKKELLEECTNNYDCRSNNCSYNICQKAGIISGTEGAVCKSKYNNNNGHNSGNYISSEYNNGDNDNYISNEYNRNNNMYNNIYNSEYNNGDTYKYIKNNNRYNNNDDTMSGGCNDGLGCSDGECKPYINSWPLDQCFSYACVQPSICWNGSCVMPRTENKFITNSCSDKCTFGYTCENNVCVPKKNAPYPSERWGLLKWNTDPLIGTWELITDINILPSVGDSLSVYNDIFIYRTDDNWIFYTKGIFKNMNFVSNVQIIILNVEFTNVGTILISYQLNGIFRCYVTNNISENINIQINDITFEYPVKNIQSAGIWSPNNNSSELNKMFLLDTSGNLYIGIVSINYINGNVNNGNFTFITGNIIYTELYSSSQTNLTINEYIYKTKENTQIYIMTNIGEYDRKFPPLENFSIYPSYILKQNIYPGVGDKLSDIGMIYLVNYPESVGGLQLRMYYRNNDSIYPGYFITDARMQIAINEKNEYYLITTIK